MSQSSEKFEKQIHRIHELIEQKGSVVTWNDKIPDPDNKDQPRQIDISIKKNKKLTIIECRIHKKVQDVKWIEELIGRRVSLKADSVIAVSNSGFTKGAILKAKEYGIVLRSLQGLTEQEIQRWGSLTRVTLVFFEFKDVKISLTIDSVGRKKPALSEVVTELKKTSTLFSIFEVVSNELESKNPRGKPCSFKCEFSVSDGLAVCGLSIISVTFEAKVKKIVKNLETPAVVAYDAPHIECSDSGVKIEQLAFGDFEITQSSNRVIIAADLGPIECPPDSKFQHIQFDFGRIVTIVKFELLRLPPFIIPLKKIQLELKTYS